MLSQGAFIKHEENGPKEREEDYILKNESTVTKKSSMSIWVNDSYSHMKSVWVILLLDLVGGMNCFNSYVREAERHQFYINVESSTCIEQIQWYLKLRP